MLIFQSMTAALGPVIDVNFVKDCFATLGKQRNTSYFIVDKKIMELYRKQMASVVPACCVVPVEAAEARKTMDYCQTVIEALIEKNIRKNHTLVAVGGGIIQDITAFIASVLFRGIDWEFYPTTLLAQADSCIGSKSSINLGKYKNLLGTFCPPSHIFIDVGFLETLPVGEIKSGIGEILHFYLIDGSGQARRLKDNYEDLIKNRRAFAEHIHLSLEIKKKLVEVDEFDKEERNIFNYGHTFGHAIESISDYTLNHGQAVTLGMDIANYVSLRLGLLNEDTFQVMRDTLSKNMPAFSLDEYKLEDYFKALSRDKKNIGNELGCILTKGPGSMHKALVPFDGKFKSIISDYFRTNSLCRMVSVNNSTKDAHLS